MDTDGSIYILIVISIIFSAFFSATETAFSTFNRIRMKNLHERGNKTAGIVLKLSDEYDIFLSTILIGNNIANILGASLATVLFINLLGADLGATASTLVYTVIILILGEVTPKTIAKEYPEAFALFAAPFVVTLKIILTPFNYFFKIWKKVLSFVFKPGKSNTISEDELLIMVDEAQVGGGIDESQGTLIKSAIEFSDLEAVDIYTPRVDIYAISKDMPHDEIYQLFKETGYSRLPVYDGNIDHIIGVMNYKDFFSVMLEKLPIEEMIKEVMYVTKTKKVKDLLVELQKSKTHMAIVLDDYGGTAGLLTLEDILEELVGDIWDEHDDIVEAIKPMNDNQYIVLGNSSIEDFLHHIHSDETPKVLTVNGWVVEKIGTLPIEGEIYEKEGYIFEILKVEGRRIDQVLITIKPKENQIEEN